MGSVRRISLVGKHKKAQSGGGFTVPSSPGPSGGGFFNRSSSGAVFSSLENEPVPPPLPFSLLPLPTSASQLSLRLPEASGSSYSLHQQPLNHPNLHLTSRRIVSASLGRSDTSSVFPLSTVSGGSGSVSASHSRSTGVALGGGLQRTPSGKVRKQSKSRTRRSEDGLREQQGGATGLTARRPSVTAKTERRSLDFVFESGVEATNISHKFFYHSLSSNHLRHLGHSPSRLRNRWWIHRRIKSKRRRRSIIRVRWPLL